MVASLRAIAGHLYHSIAIVTGAGAVAHRFLQLQLGATEEVCALVTGTPTAVTGAENDAEERAVSRGVRYRVVIEDHFPFLDLDVEIVAE